MTIYGECIGASAKIGARVAHLGDSGCELLLDEQVGTLDESFSLWLGAVGPIPANVDRASEGHVFARFIEPLDERIVEHFNARG